MKSLNIEISVRYLFSQRREYIEENTGKEENYAGYEKKQF